MKPPCDLQGSGTIELYFYGELPPAGERRVEEHVRACADCRAALEDLRAISRALAARPMVAAPGGEDWSGFMARLAEETAHAAPLGGAAHWPVAGLVAAAALVAVTTTGVMFSMRARPPAAPADAVATRPAPAPPAPADESGFEALSEEHFERSKLVVLGLAARDPARTASADWIYERELAGRLLTDTRMYRMAAQDRGLKSIAEVMGDLELVLLQASLTDARDPASLAQIQRLIRKRDLVEKLDAVAVSGL
jgi:hypothetical protein